MSLPAALLAVGACRHYLWIAAPAELQGMASKGLGACAILALLACIAWRERGQPKQLLWVICWWAWEEMQTALCSVLYMIEPWQVPPGQGICSARIDIDLGAVGILVVAYICYRLVRTDSVAKQG